MMALPRGKLLIPVEIINIKGSGLIFRNLVNENEQITVLLEFFLCFCIWS